MWKGMESMGMTTQRLLQNIAHASTLSEALRFVDRENRPTPFHVLLSEAMASRGLSPQQLATLIDVERSTLYRLLSGERLTTRNVLLRIALALRLSPERTQLLLRSGQRAELYALVRRDALILFCMNHAYTLAQTEDALLQNGEASLFERI
jgi:plasmid maintenance system antidote protein VapI